VRTLARPLVGGSVKQRPSDPMFRFLIVPVCAVRSIVFTHRMDARLRNWLWIRLAFGAGFAAILLLSSGLIDGWGRWYSPSPHYRHQTDSLLRGELALSFRPIDTRHDLTWSQGGVHQVWGLGVPLWRLPFEAFARAAGYPAFPDRIAFAVALAVWGAFVVGAVRTSGSAQPNAGDAGVRFPLAAGAILLCPVFLQLCTSRFDVYEEAVAYEYIFGTGILAGLLGQIHSPSRRGSLFLAFIAGLGPLIRPTLLFYAFSTLAVLVALSPLARTKRAVLELVAALSVGSILVLWTNQARFGHPLEFGHQLNLQHLFGSMYATRFDHPFLREPVGSAANELFGLLFGTPDFNGHDFYRERFFQDQSPTLRWREMYLRTYDRFWLAGIVAGWLLAGRSAMRLRALSPNDTDNHRHRIAVAAAIWSACTSVVLFAFYLRNGVISSRYLADLAPAFVAALVALIHGFDIPLRPGPLNRALRVASSVAFVAWLCVEGILTQGYYAGIPPVSHAQWLLQNARTNSGGILHTNVLRVGAPLLSQPTPPETSSIFRSWDSIPHNGAGWDKSTGDTASLVVLFVSEPEFVDISLSLPRGVDSRNPWVRAKLGRTWLALADQTSSSDGTTRMRFAVAESPDREAQPRVLFLAFGPPETLNRFPSGYQLHSVSWR
jgi:hypothetical protein